MPYITDTDALEVGKRYLSGEECAEFSRRMERMRHFEECVATNTPSPRCRYTDPAKNLEWCRLGLRIEAGGFEDLLGKILTMQATQKRAG